MDKTAKLLLPFFFFFISFVQKWMGLKFHRGVPIIFLN